MTRSANAVVRLLVLVVFVSACGSDAGNRDPDGSRQGSATGDCAKPEEVLEEFLLDFYANCMPTGDTVLIVQGLPNVSEVYSRSGAVGRQLSYVDGFSFDEGAATEPLDRCFIDAEEIFKTTGVWFFSANMQTLRSAFGVEGSEDLLDELNIADNDELSIGVAVTIDVGVTGQGGPYAAVVSQAVAGVEDSSQVAMSGGAVQVNYNPGQNGAIDWQIYSYDEETWTGIAVFSSTDKANTYNDREYSPYTDVSWVGDPNYAFKIALLCK